MVRPHEVPDLRDGYAEIVHEVIKHGKETSPRGYKTWEIEDACFVVKDTTRLMPFGTGRDPKIEIGLAEGVLLCGGIGSTSLLSAVSSQFNRFVDGGQLHGAYGPRVRPQMDNAVRRLYDDPDTRQAIVQIWDPLYDSVDMRDMPCTLGFGFRIRNGELHMSSTMRSQDVWLGLAYDGFFFGQLGHTVANALGIPFGRWSHHVYSLHVYERNIEVARQVHGFDGPEIVEPQGFGVPREGNPLCDDCGCQDVNFEWYRKRAESVYLGDIPIGGATKSEQFYLKFLNRFGRVLPRSNFDK